MKTYLALIALLLISIGTQAAEIYSQPPAAGNTGFISSTDFNGGSNLESFVIESFTPPTTQTLREIQWRGTRTVAVPVDFQISISASLTSPGAVWHTNNAASETPTGTPGVYDYKFTLPAGLVLTGGQGYWLQIIGIVNNYSPYTGAYWAWSTGMGGNNIHLAQVPAITGDVRIAAVAGDVAFTLLNAATVPVTIGVQALPAAGGTVTGGGTFNPGNSVTVTAAPKAGRAFINWTENGVVVSASPSYTFAADGSKTLNANFTGPNTGPYIITAVAVPNGTGTVGGAGTFNAGEIVTVDVSPADGYDFVNWTENGNAVSTSLTYNFPATANRDLQANFTINGLGMTVIATPSPANGGTIVAVGSPASYPPNSYLGGTSLALTATPAPGYHFVNWKQDPYEGRPQRVVGIVGNPTYTQVVAFGMFLTANFEANTPVLTLGVTPAASGTVTGAGAYANGSNVTASATPAVGYAFASWKNGATVVSTNPSYAMTLVNPVALTANFVATNRTITATAAPLATGSVTGAGVVGNGASVTLTAIPASGYVFSSWTLNGAPAGTENPVTFNANANYTFVANFIAAPSYVITASALPLAGGTVLGDGSYLPGNTASLSATPNAGYYFVNWTESGTPVSALTTYAFSAVGDRTLAANFAPGFTVSTSASFAPGGSVTGGGGYGTGGNVTLVATPTAGYQFTGWTEGGAVVSGSSSYAFPAAADRTLTANFLPIVGIIGSAPGTVGFAWPATATGWVLQESPDLSPASWVSSALPITTGGGQNQVSISNPSASRFFRLTHP